MNNDRKRLEDLIMRLADDQQIMVEIYEMTNRAVYIFIHGMVGNAECAKDVTQNVYLSIYQNCRRYENRGQPMSWIYGIARNESLMYLRSRQRNVLLDESIEIAAEDPDISGKVTLEMLMNALNEEEREIVSMHVSGGMSFREIASFMDLNLSTVLSKYHRSVKKMKQMIREVTE